MHGLTKNSEKSRRGIQLLETSFRRWWTSLIRELKNKHKNQLNLKQNVLVNSTLTKDG